MGRVESFQRKSYCPRTRPMCSLILAGKSSHPCSGARVLSHCAQLPKPVLSLLVLIPQPRYPSAHRILPVSLRSVSDNVSSPRLPCVCLPSGPCKLWSELIKHPVFMTSLLPFSILSNAVLPRLFHTTAHHIWPRSWGQCVQLLGAGGGEPDISKCNLSL